jgi:hypothetical protein
MIKLKLNDHIEGMLSALQTEQEAVVSDDRIRPDIRVKAVLDLEKIRIRTMRFAGGLMDDLYAIRDRSR